MLLCLCVLIFDFFYFIREKSRNLGLEKKKKQYEIWLKGCIESEAILPLEGKARKKVLKHLSHKRNLLLFTESATEYVNLPLYREQVLKWFMVNREIFLNVFNKILKKRYQIDNAFVAYIVWQFNLCGKESDDPFVIMMQEMVLMPSLHCRQNALCALSVSGEAKHIIKTFRLLTDHSIAHNTKLLTESLLTFTGSHSELAKQLWEIWDILSVEHQVACINYFRGVTDTCCLKLLDLLWNKEADSEVHFAAIRYFRKYYYKEAAGTLQEYVLNWKKYDWKYGATSALALENYPGADSEQALLAGCRSTNWHERENAAESLLKINGADAVKEIAENEENRFAKEMLLYKHEQKVGVLKIAAHNRNTLAHS
jgi:hypothetical protein